MTPAEILAVHEHRPFPLPKAPWIMYQDWHDLLFAHWALPAAVVRAVVPRELPLDLWQGQAYVGLVPFVIRNLRPRGVPPLPLISHFAEINVRTYVTVDDKPGVYFFSLDAANVSAVLGARLFFGLPYFKAKFRIESEGERIRYESRRTVRPKPAEFHATPAAKLRWETISGVMACHAGSFITAPRPRRKVKASSIQGVTRPSSVRMPSAAAATTIQDCVNRSNRRRSTMSASAPATRMTRKTGRAPAACTSDTINGEPVSEAINQPLPTIWIQVPV